jgi:tetratricopeptide (TPR) repeat protein
MLDPYTALKHAFNRIKRRMPSLNKIENKSFSLLKIMLFLLTIYFIIIVTFWILDEEDGIVVQPFETIGFGENFDGKSLATLLSFDLQRIKNIYEPVPEITVTPKGSSGNKIIPRPLDEFSITNLSIRSAHGMPLDYSLSQIGTVGAEGTSISIGNLLLSMKEFYGNKANTITCSLQRYNSSTIAFAFLEDHHSSNKDIMTFEQEAKISNEEQIPSLIDDLSYMIALEQSKRRAQPKEYDLYPQTWQTFKYVTQGRDAYNKYISLKNINYQDKINYLDKGRDMALLAIGSEPGYEGSFDLLSGLGFAYLEMGKYNEAAKIFKNITGFKQFEGALGLGLVYGTQGHYAEALNAFENATQLNPRDPDAWNYKGVILSKQGNYSEAVKSFKNTTLLNPQYATAWKYEGDALAHLGHDNHSKYNEAIQAYDKAIEIDPQYAAAWNNKGIVLYNQGKYDQSIQAFDKAIGLNKSYPDPWIYKATALERLNKHNESVKANQNALLIKNKMPGAESKNGGF